MKILNKTPIMIAVCLFINNCVPKKNPGGDNSESKALFSAVNGREVIRYGNEVCKKTKSYPGVKYDKDDKEKEDELCSINFYKNNAEDGQPGIAAAVCPKMSSTFPGVELYELEKRDKAKYEESDCRNQDNRPTKRIAKFKQSVSCAYTGSILGYYHLSRILGGSGLVPTSVIRTMSTELHTKIAKRGSQWSSDLNKQLWQQLLKTDQSPTSRDLNYFTDSNFKIIYGALSDNPSNEVRYDGINRNSQDPASAKSLFFSAPLVKKAQNPSRTGAFVERNFAKAAQELQEMRDIGDLVLMDYIFQQQDRFGNIHAKFFWYWLDEKGDISKKSIKLDSNDRPLLNEKPSPNAVVVKRLLMKDNDCGNREGHGKAFVISEVQTLRHMHPRTYKGIRFLADQWDKSAKSFFETEALLNTPDYFGATGLSGVGTRIKKAASVLTQMCKNGTLLLDLDIKDHISSNDFKDCDAILTPGDSSGDGSQKSDQGGDPTPVVTAPPEKAILTAVGDTWLKTRIVSDNSLLSDKEKCLVKSGTTLTVADIVEKIGAYSKIRLDQEKLPNCPAGFPLSADLLIFSTHFSKQ